MHIFYLLSQAANSLYNRYRIFNTILNWITQRITGCRKASDFALLSQDSYVKRFIKNEKSTLIAYLAEAGGLLGLCMGFSVISVAEIFYHCLGKSSRQLMIHF